MVSPDLPPREVAHMYTSHLQTQQKEEEAVGGGVVLVRVFCDVYCVLCGVVGSCAHVHASAFSFFSK